MREDPIVLEDWIESITGKKTYKDVSVTDLILSLILISSFFVLGFLIHNSFVAMTWGFYFMYVVVMEGYIRLTNVIGIMERYFSLTITLLLVLVTLPFAKKAYSEYSPIYLGLLLLAGATIIFKGILILFYGVVDKTHANILQPRSEFMKIKVREKYQLLEGTGFDLPTEKEIQHMSWLTFKKQGTNVLIAFILALPGILVYLVKWYFTITPVSFEKRLQASTAYLVVILIYSALPIIFLIISVNQAYGNKIEKNLHRLKNNIATRFSSNKHQNKTQKKKNEIL